MTDAELIAEIAGALNTEETGENLIQVAADAHRDELEWSSRASFMDGEPTEFLDGLTTMAEEYIQNHMKRVGARELGLDERCGNLFVPKVWDSKRDPTSFVVAVREHNDRNLQYYGGFEYIDRENRMSFGGYVFYSSLSGDESRVSACGERLAAA